MQYRNRRKGIHWLISKICEAPFSTSLSSRIRRWKCNCKIIYRQVANCIIHRNKKLFAHEKSVQSWKNLSQLNRSDELIITRLRIGHTPHIQINHKYLYQRISEPPTCSYYHAHTQTVKYLLVVFWYKPFTRNHSDDYIQVQAVLKFVLSIHLSKKIFA